MYSANEKSWFANDGTVLIRSSAARSYHVIPAACDKEKLRELGVAIADALAQGEEPNEEVNRV